MAKKILLVDDEKDMRYIMSTQFKHWGYDTLSAASAEEAFEVLSGQQCDLVLIDVRLPGANGFDACKKIKQQYPPTKVIIYTAKSDAIDTTKAREAGADDFTVKTKGLEHIHNAIKAVL